jgi:hypothetical protein
MSWRRAGFVRPDPERVEQALAGERFTELRVERFREETLHLGRPEDAPDRVGREPLDRARLREQLAASIDEQAVHPPEAALDLAGEIAREDLAPAQRGTVRSSRHRESTANEAHRVGAALLPGADRKRRELAA